MMSQFSLKKIAVSAIVVIVIIGTIWALRSLKPEKPKPTNAPRTPLVDTIKLSPGLHNPSFTTIGQTSVAEYTQLTARAPGEVLKVHVQPGSAFSKGDLLLEIDTLEQTRIVQQAQAQLEQAIALLKQETAQHSADLQLIQQDKELKRLADKSAKRYQDLFSRKLANEVQLDQAREAAYRQAASVIQRQTKIENWPSRKSQLEAQVTVAKAQLEQAESDLDRLTVKAPFDGAVAHILTSPGSFVTPQTPLLKIYDHESLFIEATFPGSISSFNSKLFKNKERISAIGHLSGKTHTLTFNHFSQSQGVKGATQGIFSVPDQEFYIPLGSTFKIEVTLPAVENSFSVPSTALHKQSYIYILDENQRLVRKSIQLIGETSVKQKRYKLIRFSEHSKASSSENKDVEIVITQMSENVNGMKVTTNQPE